MKNNNIKSSTRTVLQLFLVNPGVFMFEWRRPWYIPTRWPNLNHKTTWDYSKTMENAWFVMSICEWCELSTTNSQSVSYTIQDENTMRRLRHRRRRRWQWWRCKWLSHRHTLGYRLLWFFSVRAYVLLSAAYTESYNWMRSVRVDVLFCAPQLLWFF